jgi:hypothetical protein
MRRGDGYGPTAASLKCLSVSNAEQIRFGSVSYPLARAILSLSFSLSLSAYNSMKKPALQAPRTHQLSIFRSPPSLAAFSRFFTHIYSLLLYSCVLCSSPIVMTFGVFRDCHKRLRRRHSPRRPI